MSRSLTLLFLAAGHVSAQTTYTNSYSFTRATVEKRVDCPTFTSGRTRIIGRLADGPILSEVSVDDWYFTPEAEKALVRMKAALGRAITIRNVHRTYEEQNNGLLERVIPPFETRATGLTLRETKGPANIFIGTFGTETQPCEGFYGTRPSSMYETRLKPPVIPFGCPLEGTPFTVPTGTLNIDTLTHVHIDLHKAITTTPQRLRTDTYEMIAVPSPEPVTVDRDGSDLMVGQISRLDQSDTVFAAANTRTDAAICVNLYAFSPSDELVNCCSCRVGPESVATLSVTNDILHNLDRPPTALTIKLHATVSTDPRCRNGASSGWASVPGLDTWGTTIEEPRFSHANQSSFSRTAPKPGELSRLTERCATLTPENRIQPGICRSCRLGAADGGGLEYCSMGR